ncbi:helix-turn-helix domain-containing protein [Streptomyces bluensis]|uniref:helix-turn-helix domain-containing protein n=1 Tax=Streptomyces bluensis TaxID=33897 RepID=UPI0010629016|nr:helix-turn-helix transcriptional regulator [Streptomyces bluensis]GGZ55376.1 transcriptional regulator [Streptomyces bluensis]
MGLRANPTYRQRRFGAEVRAIRERAGFTAARAAEVMGMNASHISTVEAGRTSLSAERVRRLAAASGSEESTYVDALIELGNRTGKGWWTEYRDHLPQLFLDFAELEEVAVDVVCYEPFFVPGLLQTESYASVIHRQGYAKSLEAEQDLAVEFRLRRQQLLRKERPPRFHAIIHEAALHPSYGDSSIMREQLVRLIELSRLSHVTLQVLPFDGPVPFGTSFTMLLPPEQRLGTVLVAHVEQDLWLGEAKDLARYTDLFATLRDTALPAMDVSVPPEGHLAKDSLGLIQRLLYPLL